MASRRELVARQLPDLVLELVDLVRDAGPSSAEPVGVQLDAHALIRHEDLDERQLDLVEQPPEAELARSRPLELGERTDGGGLRRQRRIGALLALEPALLGGLLSG